MTSSPPSSTRSTPPSPPGDAVIEADVAEIIARPYPWELLQGCTVLVTGASGMIPSYVLRTLLALNDDRDTTITVLALVRDAAKARAVLGGLLDRPDVRLLVQDVAAPIDADGPVDYVVHGASAARPALHATNPVGTIRANVQGTFNLLDLCVARRSRGFVLMSSAEVYGHQPVGTELVGEDSYGGFDILAPRACYAEGKRAAETVAAVYRAQHGVDVCITRFGHVYGPVMGLDDGRVQADFAARVLAGQDIVLNSDGSAARTYTYLADAVAGLFCALLVGTETVYNVADPAGMVTIRELAERFVSARPASGLRLRYTDAVDPAGYGAAARQGLDSARLAALGWSALVDLPTGLDRTLRWHEARSATGTVTSGPLHG